MAHLTLADTILLLLLVVVMPPYSYVQGRRIARGIAPNRTAAYARTIVSWWLIASSTLFVWIHFGRSLAVLGLRLPLDLRAVAGAVLCVLAIAYINGQQRVLSKLSADKLAAVRRRFGGTAAILPRSLPEYRWFLGVALTVGICEELLYRGYLYAVTEPVIGYIGAIVASGLIFGLGHLYQGTMGVVKTSYVGIVLGIIYVGTGSLLWPMMLHFLIDVAGGTTGYRVMRDYN